MQTTTGIRARSLVTKTLTVLALIPVTACITMKGDHDELQAEVVTLKKRVAERDSQLEETLARAQEQMNLVEAQLERAENILRDNQATLGVRVDDLELDLSGVRGVAEDGQNEVAALTQNIGESRAELDQRLTALETTLKAETDIPEGKSDLMRAAERALGKKQHPQARRLFRTYLSRYPSDPKEAEVRFKIGQTLYAERDYRSALGEFYWLVQNAPESTVIHDAVYYSGLAFAKLGQCDKAEAYFNAIVKKTSTAPDTYKKQANKQLETLAKDTGKICADRRPAEEDEPATEPAS